MKPKLTILIEGYAHADANNEYFASPTTTLLQYGGKNYIVDPGCNGPLLEQRMKEVGISSSQVEALFISHYHLDHVLNIRLFPNTPVYDGSMHWDQDKETAYSDCWLVPEFKLLPTPGHADEQVSLLIDTENLGMVCIAQDVFWWEDGQQKFDTIGELMGHVDPFMSNESKLLNSRKIVLETGAQWIIPGHGKMFQTPSK